MQLVLLLTTFARVGLFTFGSGYAMLALLQQEVIDRYAWLTPEEFTDVVAIAEITPGPIMVNLATFVGYRQAGVPGAAAATLGLILPPILAILIISRFYTQLRGHPTVEAVFRGLRPVIAGLIGVAVLRMARTSIVDAWGAILFLGVIVLVYFFRVSPVLAALGGIAAGIIFFR
ncbi:MAG: chromate transporter [Bacillota bacterium]